MCDPIVFFARRAGCKPLAAFAAALSLCPILGAQTLPSPSLQYAPAAGGSTLVNSGSNAGLSTAPNNLLLKTNTTNNFSTSPAANLILADSTGPLGIGRAIDLSANASNGGAVTSMGGAASGVSIGGLGAFTLTMWYRLDSTLSTTSTTLIRIENSTSNTSKVILSLNGQKLRVDVQTAANQSKSATTSSVDTSMTQVGKWVFVAVSWNATNGATVLYKGFEDAAVASIFSGTLGTVGNLPATSFVNLGFNNLTSGGSGAFDGQLADIRLYNSVLPASQLNLIKGGVTTADTSYLAVVKGWVDSALASDYTTAKIDGLTAGTSAPDDKVSEIAAAFARMWVLTGKANSAYADRAWYALNALRGQWQRATQAQITWRIGFQAKFAFLETYRILLQNGYALDNGFQADMKAIAQASDAPTKAQDNNAGAFDGAATVQALALWPDLDVGGTWTAFAVSQWNSWATHHDTIEDSLNYNKLFVPLTVFMAERSAGVASLAPYNFNADVQSEAMHALMIRFRDQVLGSGQMPYYGDAGNATPIPDMDNWPAVFEWAARTWHDASFRWAAQTSYALNRDGLRLPLTIWLMTYAIDGADPTIAPAQPTTASALLTRNDRWSAADPDRIVLAPSRAAGAPFAMADLYPHGTHSHKEQTGQVGFFENNGTVFLYQLGYNNRGSDSANMVLINPPSTPFPWRGQPVNGVWYEVAIPTADMDVITDPSDPNYGLTLLNRPEWRWEQRSKTDSGYGYLSNVRLVAADGTETVVNATNNAAGWSGGLSAQVVEGPTSGSSALRFVVGPNASGNASTVARIPTSQAIGRAVDPAQYPYVKFWWKAEMPTAIDDQIVIYREQYAFDGQLQQDEAWLQPFTPAPVATHVETRSLARYGSFTINGYFTLRSQLTRRVAQLNDGTLVVLDTVTPDQDADGRAAGPVWQLASSAPTQIAPGIYDASGFYNTLARTTGTDRLLVVMEQATGRTFGSQTPPAPLWNNVNPYATYARQTLHAGQPVSFVTVLQPHTAAVSGATLASRVTIQRTGADTATVLLATGDGHATEIDFSANDAWAVSTVSLPLPATVTLDHLATTYDGTPKAVTVATSPAGVPVSVTYDGDSTPPTNAGSYAVVATITGPNYTGQAMGTLVIGQAAAAVQLSDLVQTYDGASKPAAVITTPAGLGVNLTYDGNSSAPTNAGGYAVTATVTDPNYTGTATATLVIERAAASVGLSDLSQTYNGTPKSATASTTPSGLAVQLTYDGSATPPVNAGSYAVVAAITDPNYTGTAAGTLIVGKATAWVALGHLTQTYDGTPKTATATTTPGGLSVLLTYDGSAAAPVDAGTYGVQATVSSPNFVGSASGALVIGQATALLTLADLHQMYDGTPKTVTTITTPDHLTVSVTYNGSTMAPSGPGSFAVVATIADRNYAASVSDTLTIATTALVRHAPKISAGVDGSLWVLSGETFTLQGSGWISGDLLVPGTPTVFRAVAATYAGTRDGTGSILPSNYTVILGGRVVVRYVVRRTDPIAIPPVSAPPAPTGARDVSLNSPGQTAGDFSTVRNLTLGGSMGQLAVPPGTYGTLTASGRSGFVFGVAGATDPAIYNLQELALSGDTRIETLGPVILVLAKGVTVSGTMGSTPHPEWLTVKIASGGATLNGNVTFNGSIEAPNGIVTLNGNTTLNGGVTSDQLTLNGASLLHQP